MKYFLTAAFIAVFAAAAGAKEIERIKLTFDIIEADKNISAFSAAPVISSLMKRKAPDAFKYLAGGDFTLAPFTEENFILRQETCDLDLTLSWQPVITGGIRKINLKYKAALYYPMQKYFELQNTIELSSGTALVMTESKAENGASDTRPIRVILSAGFIEPTFGFPILGGIGAKISSQSGYPYISDVITDGPAKAAGLKFGDEITEIDGYSTLQMSFDNVTKLLRGDPGTTVKLKIYKVENKTYEEKVLVRKMLQ